MADRQRRAARPALTDAANRVKLTLTFDARVVKQLEAWAARYQETHPGTSCGVGDAIRIIASERLAADMPAPEATP